MNPFFEAMAGAACGLIGGWLVVAGTLLVMIRRAQGPRR